MNNGSRERERTLKSWRFIFHGNRVLPDIRLVTTCNWCFQHWIMLVDSDYVYRVCFIKRKKRRALVILIWLVKYTEKSCKRRELLNLIMNERQQESQKKKFLLKSNFILILVISYGVKWFMCCPSHSNLILNTVANVN